MNVLDLLNRELENKNWTIEEKARYLYIRSCELFHYDERYDFCDLDLYDDKLLKQIRNRIIDLENLEDERVICTSHAREVVSKIMKEILGLECIDAGKGHAWSVFNDGKRYISADATLFSDLTRVKLGLTTKGYQPMGKNYNFLEELKLIDKKIGYIKEEYKNYEIEKRITGLFHEYVEYNNPDLSIEYVDDFFFYKLLTIQELFEQYKLPSFSDSEFCISYLMNKILTKDSRRITPISLFDAHTIEDWDFVNIYPFELKNEIIYFILQKIDEEFRFYETTESDAKHYVKTMQGINKHIIIK